MTPADYCAQLVREALTKGEKVSLQQLSDDTGLDVGEVRQIVIDVRERRAEVLADLSHAALPPVVALPARAPLPPPPPPPPPPPAPAPAPGLPDIVAQGLAHDSHRVRKAATKAQAAITALEQRIAEDAGRAQLRARLAKAEAEAKRLRAQLRGDTTPSQMAACDICGKTYKAAGLATHKGRAHRRGAS